MATFKMSQNFTVFVSNISFSTSSKEIADTFAQFGEIASSRIITRIIRSTRERVSRGIGFVEFKNEQACEAAIAQSGNLTIGGRALLIKKAIPKVLDSVFVRGIPAGSTKEDLLAAFPGSSDAKVVREDSADERRGFGFVRFPTEAAANDAAAKYANGLVFKGVNMDVKIARRPFDLPRRRFVRRPQ